MNSFIFHSSFRSENYHRITTMIRRQCVTHPRYCQTTSPTIFSSFWPGRVGLCGGWCPHSHSHVAGDECRPRTFAYVFDLAWGTTRIHRSRGSCSHSGKWTRSHLIHRSNLLHLFCLSQPCQRSYFSVSLSVFAVLCSQLYRWHKRLISLLVSQF